ncbi:hypothetical protein D3C78_1378220 [compost metagenome]
MVSSRRPRWLRTGLACTLQANATAANTPQTSTNHNMEVRLPSRAITNTALKANKRLCMCGCLRQRQTAKGQTKAPTFQITPGQLASQPIRPSPKITIASVCRNNASNINGINETISAVLSDFSSSFGVSGEITTSMASTSIKAKYLARV